jgi:hypothetical protein
MVLKLVSSMVQMTDDWLRSMDDRKVLGAVLSDFSSAFDVIDHELLVGKLKCYGLSKFSLIFSF